MDSTSNPYTILCLDGGGRWSLISVMALQRIFGEEALGRDVLQHFDLVAANSGGSIVLGALAENMRLDRLLDLFCTSGALFPPEPRISLRRLGHWLTRRLLHIGPKYDTREKLAILRRLLPETGGKRLTDLPEVIVQANGKLTHYLIVGFDYDWKRAKYFRSNAESLASSSDPTSATLAEAIHASSTAPVNYFNAPAALPGEVALGNRYWDGAVTGQNNPVLAGVTEALANGQGRVGHHDIRVLSIGTGTVSLPVVARRQRRLRGLVTVASRSRLFVDLAELAESILDDPPDSASFEAWIMLGNPVPPTAHGKLLGRDLSRGGEPVSLVRMSPLVRPRSEAPGAWGPPDGLTRAEFARLTNIELDARVPNDVGLLVKFARAWLDDKVPNQPIRENPYTFTPRIGHTTFSEALAAWQARTMRDAELRAAT
jgi:patatin-like phospholipase/acyl hydrolase